MLRCSSMRARSHRRWRRLTNSALGAGVGMLAVTASASAVKPEYVRIVRNQSSRESVKPRLIVLHTTTDARKSSTVVVRNEPGLRDLRKLGAWFDDPAH